MTSKDKETKAKIERMAILRFVINRYLEEYNTLQEEVWSQVQTPTEGTPQESRGQHIRIASR